MNEMLSPGKKGENAANQRLITVDASVLETSQGVRPPPVRHFGRPPKRMLELRAILDAGYKDKDQIAGMMRIPRKFLNVYLERLAQRDADRADHPHADCSEEHVTTIDGEIICASRVHGQVVEYVQAQPAHKKGEPVSFPNSAHWGNGLGSPRPASALRSRRQYYNKALLEKGGYEVMLVKQLVCDALDTPDTEFGNLISNRLAELAEEELRKRRVDRLIDEHECVLIVKQALRLLTKETPIACRYVNTERLRLATKEPGNKITALLDDGHE